MALRLTEAGFALLAVGNQKGTKGCWETNDVETVTALLHEWRKKRSRHQQHHVPMKVPLFLLGPSSGGFFATQAARHWREVRGLSVQISVPSADDVRAPLPSGSAALPPLQLVLMKRDSGKLRDAAALRSTLPAGAFEQIVVAPRALASTFFSDAMPGLAPTLSAAVLDGLIAAGHVDATTRMLKAHPYRGTAHATGMCL